MTTEESSYQIGADCSLGSSTSEVFATFWSEAEQKFVYVPLGKAEVELILCATSANVRTFKNPDGTFEHIIKATDPELAKWPEEID